MVLLPNKKGEWQPRTFAAQELSKFVIDVFPELNSELQADEGVHTVFMFLTERCRLAIKNAEYEKLKLVFNSLSQIIELKGADSEIENAIQNSFLEETDFSSVNGAKIVELLPENLKKILIAG